MLEQIELLEYELESKIILLCSQTRVDTDRIRAAFANRHPAVNWPYIFKVAGRNGLLPLVSSNLLRKFPDLLEEEIHASLSEFLGVHTRNNLFQTRKLIEISEILGAAGIPMLPFKGPALASQAYGEISLRQFVDLDILVQPRHFDKAVELLKSCGYSSIGKASWLKRKSLFFTRKKDIGLVSADGQVRIELHWKLSGTHFSMPVEIDQLWKRLETVKIGGARLRSMPFHDLFVYLCLHGSRHGWEKLAWVCDINEIVRQTKRTKGQIDWLEVRQHARKHGCERSVELGLFLIRDLLGTKGDYPEMERIMSNEAFKAIATKLRKTAFATERSSTEMSGWYLYHLSLKERFVDRLRIRMVYLLWYLRIAVRPNEIDEAVFRLPSILHPLHYLIRPVRVFLSKFVRNFG